MRLPLAVVCSRVRLEEKLIFEALERRGVPYERLDERDLSFAVGGTGGTEGGQPPAGRRFCALLSRAISQTQALYAARCFEAQGIPVVNPSQVIETCGDKLLTTLALRRDGIPVPRTTLALSTKAGLEAIEKMGYPVVVKPLTGSWGRLLARVNDRDGAEALLEHKEALGSPQQRILYIQEYVKKPGRDIRTIVVGDRVCSAMYRISRHWLTNTARGTEVAPCPISGEVEVLSLRAARAVAKGSPLGAAVAVDLLESPSGQVLVNEVNHTMEFHGTIEAPPTQSGSWSPASPRAERRSS